MIAVVLHVQRGKYANRCVYRGSWSRPIWERTDMGPSVW